MATTLKDVADHAGVSIKTVSNVVNNHPHISERMRSRVQASLDTLGYRPNLAARQLKHGRGGFIALAVAVIGTRWGEFTPDTRPDLYEQPGRFLRDTLQAWVGGATGLGQGNYNAGAAPVTAVVWVIRTLGAPA